MSREFTDSELQAVCGAVTRASSAPLPFQEGSDALLTLGVVELFGKILGAAQTAVLEPLLG